MPKTPQQIFDSLLVEAKKDDNILGLFLSGSRGKGFEHEHSDYDVEIIVGDNVAQEYGSRYDELETDGIDIVTYGISEFRDHAKWDGPTPHWECPSYAHVTVLVDKTGEVQKLVDEKGTVPKEKKDDFINLSLDAYLNGFFRSVKSHLRKDDIGVRLEAAQSIQPVLNALFALEDRLAPYPDYLVRELEARPLTRFFYDTDQVPGVVGRILISPDLKSQQNFAGHIEKAFRKEGYNQVFDDWGDKLPWAMEMVS